MKISNNEALEMINGKNRSIKRWWMVLAFILLAAFAALPSSLGTQVVLAGRDDERGQNVDITFTKWITTVPNMAGVVGGDVGTGTFAGEVLKRVPGSDFTNIEAIYHINGRKHSFTAHLFVVQNEATRTAVLRGVITDGWLKGRLVRGNYTIISCTESASGVCFQGTLHVRAGRGH